MGTSVITAKVTTKGQITVPKSVRDHLGIEPGDEVEFIEDDGQYRVRRRPTGSAFARYRGLLEHLRGRASDEIVRDLRGHGP